MEKIRMMSKKDSSSTVKQNPVTLRLVWPQWQGAGVESIRKLFSDVPFEEARRGYAVGAAVLNAVLPTDSGPTALVPVEYGDVVDSNEIIFGLGAEPDGLTSNEVRRLVADVSAVVDVVGLTIAEFIPRLVIRLQQRCCATSRSSNIPARAHVEEGQVTGRTPSLEYRNLFGRQASS
jgi:arginase